MLLVLGSAHGSTARYLLSSPSALRWVMKSTRFPLQMHNQVKINTRVAWTKGQQQKHTGPGSRCWPVVSFFLSPTELHHSAFPPLPENEGTRYLYIFPCDETHRHCASTQEDHTLHGSILRNVQNRHTIVIRVEGAGTQKECLLLVSCVGERGTLDRYCVCHNICVGVRGHFVYLAFLFHLTEFQNQTLFRRLHGKHFYLLRHLDAPSLPAKVSLS